MQLQYTFDCSFFQCGRQISRRKCRSLTLILSKVEIQEFLESVLFVVVIYRLPITQSESWMSLEAELTQVGCGLTVFIYDNSPEPQSMPQQDKIKMYYHHDSSNAGVSAAYNAGHALASQLEKRWLFLLDQDTRWPVGTLAQYASANKINPGGKIFVPIVCDKNGIVSPFLFQFGGGKRIGSVPYNLIPLKKYKAINSGMLIRTESFGMVGGYENSIQLDFSDIAFLWKLQKICDHLIIVNTELQLSFSGSSTMIFHDALDRFKIYCNGAKSLGVMLDEKGMLWFRSLIRALHLTIRFGSGRFLLVHIQIWSKAI